MSSSLLGLLDQLHNQCLEMASQVLVSVERATEAVRTIDPKAAKNVLESEDKIDEQEVHIEQAAIDLLSLYSPAASDFRNVFSVVKINSDLERIGDCAVNIAQQVTPLYASGVDLHPDVRLIADTTVQQVQQTIRCLAGRDHELAAKICQNDDMIDALYNQILQDLQAGMQAHSQSVPGDLAMIMIAKNFERIGDHCNNIAEDIIFLRRGRIIRHVHENPRKA